MKKLIASLLCTAYLFSCTKENEPLQEFKIKVGEQFTIELEANWSTGYSWEWENRQEVFAVDTISRVYIQLEPGMEGSAGVEKWTFVGKDVGTETIIFYYMRANSQDSEPSKTREYLVDVVSSW